ncbi:hypothetical protein ACFLT9_07305 [Acidobacteriota bacterium]
MHFSDAFHRMIKVIIPVEDSLDPVTGFKTIYNIGKELNDDSLDKKTPFPE